MRPRRLKKTVSLMKRLISKTNLRYIGEHLQCDNYQTGDKARLGLYNLQEGECLVRDKLTLPALFFVIKGEVNITGIRYARTVGAGYMFIKPAGSSFYCKAGLPSTLIRMSFDMDFTICNKYSLTELKDYAARQHVEAPYLLPIADPLADELEATETAMGYSLMCRHYQKMKVDILLILLRGFYTKEELAALFRPVVSADIDFKNKILSIGDEAKSVKELINLTGMPPTTFNRKFQNAFGMSAGQWMTENKKEGILKDIVLTNISVAQIAKKYGFTSNYFISFSKDHFGYTPTELRKMYNPDPGGTK